MDDDLTGDPGLDDELRRTFDHAAPPAGSTDRAWEQITPRLHRARRRHRAAVVGASLLVVFGISATALASDPLDRRTDVLTPAGQPIESPSGTRETSTTTAEIPSTSTTGLAVPTPPATGDPSDGTGGTGTLPDDPGGETTTTTRPAETTTYTAPGGRATVRFAGGALTLVDFAANPGFSAEVAKAEPDDVEVRFRPESGPDSRIRVRVENGVVIPETE